MKIKSIIVTLMIGSLYFSNVYAQSSELESQAKSYIERNSEKSGKTKFSDLKLQSVRKGLSGETLRFNQEMNGVPILNGDIAVHFNKQGAITYLAETVYTKNLQKINTIPTISAQSALEKAKIASEPKGNIEFEENKLFVYNLDGNTKLVYRVTINSYEKKGSWETIVDAHTGEIISMKDVSIYHKGHDEPKKIPKKKFVGPVNKAFKTAGTAYVFDPDPLSKVQATYGGNYVDGSDATNTSLDAARSLVNLIDVDLTNGVYTLKNSYVTIADFESPATGLFTQSTPNFLFNRNDQGFEAVNVFYHFDKSLRYINETLGILCKPTLNNGSVFFDPHGLSGSDNSHYVPSTQRLAFGEGGVDDAEDADVVLHELGHGIHHWITGLSSSSSQGLGEGSGDYWAMSYSRSLNQWASSTPQYQWMFSWDGHNPFWAGRITNYTATYPGGLVGQIHADGQIWASCLMRIYDQIGKEKTDRIFLEGLSLTNSSANQQTAAVAVRQAAIDMLGTFGFTCNDVNIITQEMTTTGYTLPAYTCTMAVNEVGTKDLVGIYPNPTKDILNVELKTKQKGKGIIYNVEGRKILEVNLSSGKNSIDVSDIQKGGYILTIEEIGSYKFIKE